ncbi:DUF1176 domain-containing protein [Luteimonas gilva]|nr:DUF1176 domain-containing protein [Luteimonas gilva]
MRRLLIPIAFVLAWPAMAAQPLYREIKDFVVACDNGGACRALGLAQEDGGNPLLLDLHRDAGPSGKATLRLSAARRFAARDLRVDGKTSTVSALPWRDAGDANGGALELQDPNAIAKFVDLARNAGAITIGRGQDSANLSLSGFSAALLLVDETQGRIGNETAWLRRGAKPASAVPAAGALPALPPPPKSAALSRAQATSLIAAVRRQQSKLIAGEECDTSNPDLSPDSAYALSGDEALVLLNCFNGAYQSASLGFRIDRAGRGPARRLVLQAPIRTGDNDGRIDYFTNADYDPASATLSHAAKGRGLGDCGEAASWRFDGREFRLASYAYLGRCSGADPGDWPTLFRSAGR